MRSNNALDWQWIAARPCYSVYFLLSTFCSDAPLTLGAHVRCMPIAFEKLLVYQKSVALADAVCAATRVFRAKWFRSACLLLGQDESPAIRNGAARCRVCPGHR
jgi:hypothetical protein